MREIDGEDRADFTLDVVCDHRQDPACNEPERLVAVAYHVPEPANTIGFIEWRAARVVTDGVEQGDSLRTYWDEIRRLTAGMSVDRRASILRSRDEQLRLLSRNGGRPMGSENWNFRCGDCRLTVPGRYETMHPILERLRAAAVCRISLHALRGRVTE